MQIRYKNTYFDTLAFNTMHQFFNPVMQGLYLSVIVLVFVQTEHVAALAKIISGVIAYISLWLFQVLFTAIYLISRKNHSVITEHTLEIQDDSLYEQTSFNRSYFHWKGGVVRVVKRGAYIAVYVTANSALIIPGRAFSSKSHRDEVYSLLKEKSEA